MIDADWNRKAGEGTHATLSAFDVHNTLITAGPDFQVGFEDKMPTANVDIAREIIQILDLPVPQEVTGRGLIEARRNSSKKRFSEVRPQILEASRDFSDGRWKQTFQVSRYLAGEYIDEGNGSFTKK
jgi:hypothetical protein